MTDYRNATHMIWDVCKNLPEISNSDLRQTILKAYPKCRPNTILNEASKARNCPHPYKANTDVIINQPAKMAGVTVGMLQHYNKRITKNECAYILMGMGFGTAGAFKQADEHYKPDGVNIKSQVDDI